MAPSTAANATPKSVRRRREILRRGTELFDRKGYANTSLDDIARAVGITREGIYYYFRNRSEILLNIIEPQSRALLEGMREIMARTDDDHADKLHAAMRNHLERFDRHCLEMTVSLRDGYLDDDEVQRQMRRIWKDYEGMWTELIAQGQRSGAFRRVGEPKMLAFAILGMCNWLARWYDPGKETSIDELIRSYSRLVGSGLVADGREERS